LPDPGLHNPKLASWLRLFDKYDRGPTFPADLYDSLPARTSFPALVDQASRFVQHAHDRRICCDYARQQQLFGAGINTSLAADHLRLILQHGAEAACELTQRAHQPSYLQPDIVRAEFALFPEFETLLALAVEGAHIAVPTDWIPNCGIGVTGAPMPCAWLHPYTYASLKSKR
jgi:hypothetical protein